MPPRNTPVLCLHAANPYLALLIKRQGQRVCQIGIAVRTWTSTPGTQPSWPEWCAMCISLLGSPPVGGLIRISEDSAGSRSGPSCVHDTAVRRRGPRPAMFTPPGVMHGIWHPNVQIEEAQESGQIHHSGGVSDLRQRRTRSGNAERCTKPDCDQQKHRA